MWRLNNPTMVGLFVLAATFLGTGTIIFVASVRLFRSEATVITYFAESVNGLTIGAPVKFKGVPIGKVKDIRISHNQLPSRNNSYIPVFLSIDLTKVGRKLDKGVVFDFQNWETSQKIFRDGLRSQLQLLSFITGQLYVELDFFGEPGSMYRQVQVIPEYLEIPSVRSEMEELGTSAADIIAQFATINVKQITDDLGSLLKRLDSLVAGVDVAAWNSAVLDTTVAMQKTMAALEIEETVPEFRATLASLRSITTKLETSIDPALEDYHSALGNLAVTLERSNKVLDNLEELTDSDGAVRAELIQTFEALQKASQSAEELLSYLERNPRAILTGRELP